MILSLSDWRREYMKAGLNKAELDPNPLLQFQKWFQQAVDAGILEPNAVVLATADKQARPSARTMLLKAVDERGFTFFTNYESRKGRDLSENPRAALIFPWIELERQVIVNGPVARVSREESEAYFKVRPRGSRLGAWASKQSSVISGRAELEERIARLETQFPDEEIPMPANWGGFLLTPEQIEFWQGRPSRLHDRLQYTKESSGHWRIERLSP